MVLEVGAGEGALTERLAEAAAHVHAIELDRRLEAELAAVAARPNVSVHWGDAMKLDLGDAATAADRIVSNLPYSVATPVILRTIAELPSVERVDADGPARDRRSAPGRARARAPTASPSVLVQLAAEVSCCAPSTRPCSGRGRGSSRR